ncbi:MAG TPA: PhnD/SsuA/transferrin family substrate-binding protein [Noviherbaspirillum sp.]|nr:PhnD/SsuA/transferrin family substrate-binding protein [Noviherbaspirillum sp.]
MLKLVLALVSVFLLHAAPAAARDVDIGVFAFQGEQAAISDWSPLLDYLNNALPDHRFRMRHYDAAGLSSAIRNDDVALVITNPGYYVSMESDFGLSRIATLVSPSIGTASSALGAVIFSRADQQALQTLSDLNGRTLAAVAPEGFGGYLIGARELLANGIDPERAIERTLFVGLPMNRVVEAVQRGDADAGVVRTCHLEQMAAQGQIRLSDFRIIGRVPDDKFPCARSTPLYPDWPIAVTRALDPAIAKAVARALLDMPETDEGMNWSVPADYQPVRDLFYELKAGPYAYLRDITPVGLARRFWPWLLGISVLLVAGVVHTIRVEYQVHRRTAELRDSLQVRKVVEDRMRENQERMEHLSRLSVLGELSGSLAHEINQPLTSIATYARSVLRRQAGGTLTPEAITEACTEIANEAERAGGTVQRIRHFARKRAAARDPIDLSAVAEEARRLIVGILARPPVISIEDRTSGGCTVLADAPQIQQVLLNLIKNAVDASRDLAIERQAIRITIESDGPWVVVHILDGGAGLDPSQLSHLFEPFFTTKPDGLGLGLPICKTIVESHGGRLWAEPNADGPGMRFSFSLPCHEHAP